MLINRRELSKKILGFLGLACFLKSADVAASSPQIVNINSFKVGDRVVDQDGEIGTVESINQKMRRNDKLVDAVTVWYDEPKKYIGGEYWPDGRPNSGNGCSGSYGGKRYGNYIDELFHLPFELHRLVKTKNENYGGPGPNKVLYYKVHKETQTLFMYVVDSKKGFPHVFYHPANEFVSYFNQTRRIVGYNPTTKIATISSNT